MSSPGDSVTFSDSVVLLAAYSPGDAITSLKLIVVQLALYSPGGDILRNTAATTPGAIFPYNNYKNTNILLHKPIIYCKAIQVHLCFSWM